MSSDTSSDSDSDDLEARRYKLYCKLRDTVKEEMTTLALDFDDAVNACLMVAVEAAVGLGSPVAEIKVLFLTAAARLFDGRVKMELKRERLLSS